jgi:NADPH-dependent 2,4-dienoyl-CoA reductase/sulfur reductase-like enzyme
MRRYILVGAGAAGIGAAEAIRSQDPAGEIMVLSEEQAGFYSRPGLAYYLTGEVSERQLFPFSEADFRRLELRQVHSRARCIHPQQHQLELQDDKRLPYDRLLVATGSTAINSDAPGAGLKGVVKLDNLEDAKSILALARKKAHAVVVGGGITALEIVEGLVCRGVHTTYLSRGDRYWSNVLDEIESQIIERRLREDNVHIHYHSELAEILGQSGMVKGVRTKDGREIPCTMLAVAIGVKPRLELAVASGLRLERGILVDQTLQTSAPDVFAAGDVAQVYDPFAGKYVLDTLWSPARDQGRCAGLNMAGVKTHYQKGIAFNVTRLAGLTTTIIGQVGGGRDADMLGIARGDSETWRQLPDAIAAQAGFEVNHLRILIGQQHLLGAIIMGDQTLSWPLQNLIANLVDITSIRESLLQPGAPLADRLTDFWSHWKEKDADNPGRPAKQP